MFGKVPRLRALEVRKQLLLAESELNRALLCGDWQTWVQAARALTDRARTIAGWASAAGLLAAGGAALRRRAVVAAQQKRSWFQRALNGVELALSLGRALRALSGRKPGPES